MRKTKAIVKLEQQFRREAEMGADYCRSLEAEVREKNAVIRLMVKGAEAMEAELVKLRKRGDDVPF